MFSLNFRGEHAFCVHLIFDKARASKLGLSRLDNLTITVLIVI